MAEAQIIANRFELNTLLRQGGMGEVYRGTDQQTGETVAIKKLRLDVFGDDQKSGIERFRREGETLRALDHPNIIKIITTVEEQNAHYIVMDYAAGGSLADLLRDRGRMPLKQGVQTALDLTDALTRAHRLGIVHRDIKPDNVLLKADKTPLLSDFGLAHVNSSTLTHSGVMVGTYLYLPPEAFNGQTLDARADIWAFGVMLFQMITGQLPFAGDSAGAITLAVLSRPVPDPKLLRNDIPASLSTLIFRMLEKDPLQRIQSMRQVGVELDSILGLITNEGINTAVPTPERRVASNPGHPLSESNVPNNIPQAATPFVGRDAEIADLRTLISDLTVRMVTIFGPGGMGKTRLAFEVAQQMLHSNFRDGVFVVSLAPLTDPDRIITAIAEEAGFNFFDTVSNTSSKTQLINYLHDKFMLIVLDNFEHVMDGATLVADILRATSNIKFLVTSRERLNLKGEVVFDIEGMSYPTEPAAIQNLIAPDENTVTALAIPEYSAITLFFQCVQRQRPQTKFEDTDISHVIRVCQLVRGMPLGIELAAAWFEALPLAEIVQEIEANLDFLESNARDLPERQRSIRAVFQYTWNMLNETERSAFKRLSVFRGGFSRNAAQQIAEASLLSLSRLIDKSLLRRTQDGRYEVHELLRQYAEAQLQADNETWQLIRSRHSAYYLNFLSTRGERLKAHEQTMILKEIEIELENVRNGWLYAVAARNNEALYPALESFWNYHIYRDRIHEGEAIFAQTINGLRGQPAEGLPGLTLGFALILHAAIAHRVGQQELSLRHFSEGTALLEKVNAQRELALAHVWNVNGSEAEVTSRIRLGREELARLDDRWGLAYADTILGQRLNINGVAEAKDYMLESLEITQQIGDPLGQAGALSSLGWYCFFTGNYLDGMRYFDQGRKLYQQTGTPGGVASSLRGMGTIAWSDGHFDDAQKYMTEALSMYRRLGSQWGIANCVTGLGIVAWRRGRPEQALQPLRESVEAYRKLGVQRSISNALVNLGHPLIDLGRYQEALRVFREALDLGLPIGANLPVLEAIAGIGAIYGLSALETPAIQLLNFVQCHPVVSAEVREIAEKYYQELEWQIEIQLSPGQVNDLAVAGKALTMEEAAALAYEYLKVDHPAVIA